jgi:hypothetical protein
VDRRTSDAHENAGKPSDGQLSLCRLAEP